MFQYHASLQLCRILSASHSFYCKVENNSAVFRSFSTHSLLPVDTHCLQEFCLLRENEHAKTQPKLSTGYCIAKVYIMFRFTTNLIYHSTSFAVDSKMVLLSFCTSQALTGQLQQQWYWQWLAPKLNRLHLRKHS